MATEKRLIDANALLEKVQFRLPIDNQNAEVIAGCVDITRRLIENAPTVDAIVVVRCRDCKYSEPCKPHKKIWCPRIGRYLNADFYCAEGAKRE